MNHTAGSNIGICLGPKKVQCRESRNSDLSWAQTSQKLLQREDVVERSIGGVNPEGEGKNGITTTQACEVLINYAASGNFRLFLKAIIAEKKSTDQKSMLRQVMTEKKFQNVG